MFKLLDQLTVARKIIVLDRGIAPAGVPLERGTIEYREWAKRKRKYSRSAGRDVKREMHRYKRGTPKSGPGGKVKSRKQASAIGLSKARKKRKRVPKQRS